MPDGLRLSGIFRGNGRPSCVFQAGHPMQESGTRPGLNLQQDFFFFLSLSHRHQPPREITGPKNPQLREKFWRYRPGSQQSVVISTPPLIVLMAKLDVRVSSSLLRPELFYAEKCSNLSTFHPVPSGGHQTLRGPVLITATFTGPRRKTLFPKAARPAAPCATYCYHASRCHWDVLLKWRA